MTVYVVPDAIHSYICLAGDTRPDTTGLPIGSRVIVADTSAEEMFVGYYYASGVLTVSDQPEAGDTIDIGSTTYTFVADEDFDSADEIAVGASVAEAVANIVSAINGTDGVNSANADVSAEATGAGEVTITSFVTGTAANAKQTVYTPNAAVTNAFAAATLTGGYDEWTTLP